MYNFISDISNNFLYSSQPSLNINGIFNYDINKEILIFNSNDISNNNSNEDFEIVEVEDINENKLNEEEEKEKILYINEIKDEILRINRIIEYLIINVDINKISIPYYKIYDYSELSKNLRTKIKNNNHIFDIKKFILKNRINNDEFKNLVKKSLNKEDVNLNEFKQMTFFILLQIINIYDNYQKALKYSLAIIDKSPLIFKNKEQIINISKTKDFFNINDTNNSIIIHHLDLIKNTFSKEGKRTTKIEINKKKEKNSYEIIFS